MPAPLPKQPAGAREDMPEGAAYEGYSILSADIIRPAVRDDKPIRQRKPEVMKKGPAGHRCERGGTGEQNKERGEGDTASMRLDARCGWESWMCGMHGQSAGRRPHGEKGTAVQN